MPAYFTESEGRCNATEWAVSPWLPTQLGGHGVSSLLARGLETESPGAGFIPARFTADLLRPVLNEPIAVLTNVIRDGRRVRVVDASIVQHGEEGEAITPFQRAAFVGDTANMVCNWGTEGIGYINSDLTLTMSRLPEGPELGLLAQEHFAAEGISVGTAMLYDRVGPFGTCVVTGVSNARRQVDMPTFMASFSEA